jgi:cytochrome b561
VSTGKRVNGKRTDGTNNGQFTLFSRILHWTMAAMILTMLFIGVAMVASLLDYHLLVSIHRPLGIAILVLVIVRYVNRRINPPPLFPASMSSEERFVAKTSEMLMYAMMFAMPLIGWAMLSAERYPNRTVWTAAFAADPSAQCDALCDPAKNAHHRRVPVLPDFRRTFQRYSLPYAHHA